MSYVAPLHFWHNRFVLQRTRPSQLVSLLMTLHGLPGAREMHEQYMRDMEAWHEKRRQIEADEREWWNQHTSDVVPEDSPKEGHP